MDNKQLVLISSDNNIKIIDEFETDEFKLTLYNNIDKVTKDDINIILIDTNIGKKEVFRTIDKIKNEFLKVNNGIIICLDKSDVDDLNQYISIGANDYLLKPFTIEKLKVRINTQINVIKAERNSKMKDIQFDALLNNTPFMAWFKDKDSNYIKVNNEVMEHSGKTMEQIKGHSDHYVWPGMVGDRCRQFDIEVMTKRKQVVFDEIIPGKKGYRQFSMYKAPVYDEFDEVIGTIGIARDITDLKNKDAKLQMFMDNLPFPVWLTDTKGVYVDGNKKFSDYFNVSSTELLGKTPEEIYSKDLVKQLYKENKELLKVKKTIKFESTIETSVGIRQVEIYKTPVFDIGNQLIGITNALVDVTDIEEAHKKIKKQAYTDSLTDIFNRRALYSYMENESNYSKIGMLLINIDDFKDINDYYGHNFGDKVIKDLAQGLKKICKNNFVCRFSGDEFLVVFKNVEDENVICHVAKNITEKILTYGRNEFSVSMGIAMGDNTSDLNRFLLKLDLAMSKSKQLGKNTFTVYTKDIEDEKNLILNIEKDLMHAVERNEVKVFYQPQYTIGKKLKGFEALFRWQNEKYKDIPVIKIIEIMETSNLIIDIGYYVMSQACKFAKKINKGRKDKIVVSVNISAIQIMQSDFIEKTKSIIEEIDVCAEFIGLEITETILVKNIEENIIKLKALKDMGITISLDDFGTGYSSLNYIVNMPLSIIKIDRSFVNGMDVKDEYVKLLKLIIASSHSLNLPIVAEGVETEDQLDKLNKMNVDYVQGYLFSKPIEESAALKLL